MSQSQSANRNQSARKTNPARKPQDGMLVANLPQALDAADQVPADLPEAGDEPRGYRNCGMLICQWPTRAGVNRQLCGRCVRPHSRAHARAGWKPWVEANCEFTYRSAAGYMKAAQQKCNALHFSSLREALGYGTADTLARG